MTTTPAPSDNRRGVSRPLGHRHEAAIYRQRPSLQLAPALLVSFFVAGGLLALPRAQRTHRADKSGGVSVEIPQSPPLAPAAHWVYPRDHRSPTPRLARRCRTDRCRHRRRQDGDRREQCRRQVHRRPLLARCRHRGLARQGRRGLGQDPRERTSLHRRRRVRPTRCSSSPTSPRTRTCCFSTSAPPTCR